MKHPSPPLKKKTKNKRRRNRFRSPDFSVPATTEREPTRRQRRGAYIPHAATIHTMSVTPVALLDYSDLFQSPQCSFLLIRVCYDCNNCNCNSICKNLN